MKPITRIILFFVLASMAACTHQPKTKTYTYIDLSKFEDGIHHWNLYSRIRSGERFDTIDIVGIADNLLAYQNEDGGWPKNIDWLAKLDLDTVISDLSA